MIQPLNLLSILPQYLEHLTLSNKVSAHNISNAGTPGFKALTVAKPSFADYLSGTQNKAASLMTTSPNHISSRGLEERNAHVYFADGGEEKPNGNNVSLPQETAKLTRNQLEYNQGITIYRKLQELLTIAARGKV